MRIQIDFDEKDRSPNVLALERFLNFNLIGINHESVFEAVFITFIQNAKKSQKFKRRFLYKKYADISVPFDFNNYSELNLDDFNSAFETIIKYINAIDEIKVTNQHSLSLQLSEDLISLGSLLPTNSSTLFALNENAVELDKIIHLKRMDCRTQQRVNNKRELLKKIKGFRAYDKKESQLLRPYLNKITDVLEECLKLYPFFSPAYSEIYFSISDTLEDAKTEFPYEIWYEYTYVAIDYNKFESLNISERFYYLLEILTVALIDICNIDHLDRVVVEKICFRMQTEIKMFLVKNTAEQIAVELKTFPLNEKILLNRKSALS